MNIGLCFPYTQENLSREVMLEWFRRVDEGPFSTISCGERMVGSSVDMMATLAAAAAVTQRIRIVPLHESSECEEEREARAGDPERHPDRSLARWTIATTCASGVVPPPLGAAARLPLQALHVEVDGQ